MGAVGVRGGGVGGVKIRQPEQRQRVEDSLYWTGARSWPGPLPWARRSSRRLCAARKMCTCREGVQGSNGKTCMGDVHGRRVRKTWEDVQEAMGRRAGKTWTCREVSREDMGRRGCREEVQGRRAGKICRKDVNAGKTCRADMGRRDGKTCREDMGRRAREDVNEGKTCREDVHSGKT